MRVKGWIVLIMALCVSLINVGMVQTQDQSSDPDAPEIVGISAYWGGNYDLALTALDVAVARDPNNAEILAYRGATRAHLGDEEGAEADYALSLSLDPVTEEDFMIGKPSLVEVLQAEVDIDRGRAFEAAVKGHDLTRVEPDNPIGYFLMGRAYLSDPQTSLISAVSELDKAIERDTQEYEGLTASLYVYRGEAYRRTEQYDKALADAETALSYYPDSNLGLRLRGQISIDQAQYELAVVQLSRVLDLYPVDPYTLALRGKAYTMLREYDLALKDLDAVLIMYPQYTFPLITRAEIYLGTGKNQQAVDNLTVLLALDPTFAYGYAMRGEAYGWLGEFDQSLDDLNRSIELYPEGAYAWRSRGITYASMEKYDLAMSDLNEAVRLDPGDRNTHYARMRIAFSQGQYGVAYVDFISLVLIDLTSSNR